MYASISAIRFSWKIPCCRLKERENLSTKSSIPIIRNNSFPLRYLLKKTVARNRDTLLSLVSFSLMNEAKKEVIKRSGFYHSRANREFVTLDRAYAREISRPSSYLPYLNGMMEDEADFPGRTTGKAIAE